MGGKDIWYEEDMVYLPCCIDVCSGNESTVES